MTGKVIILGKVGQLADACGALLGEQALLIGTSAIDLRQADFTQALDQFVRAQPISAAAYTQVDAAEGAGREEAFRVNGHAVGELTKWAERRQLPLVHFSTEYVFADSDLCPRDELD